MLDGGEIDNNLLKQFISQVNSGDIAWHKLENFLVDLQTQLPTNRHISSALVLTIELRSQQPVLEEKEFVA